ncbi:hypothetical protein DL767_004896 [Monosporascus sp. MG133]|nr:hypothetical protein DL767_004896 [Monosporascus sp. MG133]
MSADVYTPPPDSSYLLATPFSMPTDKGGRWAVSFAGNGSAVLVAALSVVITMSFLCLWNFICFIAMFFDGKDKRRRRYVALVTLWNSNDSWFALKELLTYTYRCVPSNAGNAGNAGNARESWSDFVYGLTFCILAFAVFAGSIAIGIVGPSLVQIGNVAPVRPSILFYPSTPAVDPVQQLQDFGLRAPGVMRALGSVEAAEVTLRSRVFIEPHPSYPNRENGDRVIGFTYNYLLSGVDLGLQGGTDLELAVSGSCITEYGWYNETAEEDPTDGYNSTLSDAYLLWNNASEPAWVFLNYFDTLHAPMASFQLHPQGYEQLLGSSNVSYAVIVHSARRSSISPGSDPWYATEPRDRPDVRRFNAGYRMKRQRPVLSCWQQDKWRYGTQNVASVYDLKRIPGIQIPMVLLEVLETTFGTSPMIVRLGNASGDSALRSRTTSPNGVVDAEASSIRGDMDRLLLASFAASRNVFTDATMFGRQENYPNVFEGPNALPKAGAGNFVVSSPDIKTFSLTGIVAIAVIFVALLLTNSVVSLLVRFHHGRQGSGQTSLVTNDRWTRFHVLMAVQLFRCMYEPGAATASRQWSCGASVPAWDGESVKLVRDTSHTHCKGHINKETHCPPEKAEENHLNNGKGPNAEAKYKVRSTIDDVTPSP